MQSTINATIAGLAEDDLMYRYHADDGAAGGEGGSCCEHRMRRPGPS
jgi:hypothetical protein